MMRVSSAYCTIGKEKSRHKALVIGEALVLKHCLSDTARDQQLKQTTWVKEDLLVLLLFYSKRFCQVLHLLTQLRFQTGKWILSKKAGYLQTPWRALVLTLPHVPSYQNLSQNPTSGL